jgi:hypothetical protein
MSHNVLLLEPQETCRSKCPPADGINAAFEIMGYGTFGWQVVREATLLSRVRGRGSLGGKLCKGALHYLCGAGVRMLSGHGDVLTRPLLAEQAQHPPSANKMSTPFTAWTVSPPVKRARKSRASTICVVESPERGGDGSWRFGRRDRGQSPSRRRKACRSVAIRSACLAATVRPEFRARGARDS